MKAGAQFAVGIDLGTTNTALAYAAIPEAGSVEAATIKILDLPQHIAEGQVANRSLLPSFLYLASQTEFPNGALNLPWAAARNFSVGEFARARGAEVPMRLVSSAKSWLAHAGVDRTAAILPPAPAGAEPVDVERISPLEASARYLAHLRDAWNTQIADGDDSKRLEKQDVFLAVPASFDAVARELTVRAAEAAGLEVTLIEEPQAAFYSWLNHHGDDWRKKLHVGDVILVCDIGGGTTDFSLIAVTEEDGNLALERIAVGEHILLGGDNIDLALAHTLAQRLATDGTKLDGWQMRGLVHGCRAAKEALLADGKLQSHPVTVLGRGRSVIGGTIKCVLERSDIEALVIDGFFPQCSAADRPHQRRRMGLQEIGLPYAADAAVTRHLAKFLGDHHSSITAVLWNGGVMKSELLRERIKSALTAWSNTPPATLEGTDPDLAVAYGSAYFGLVRHGKGVRIRGGTARAYYVGVESSMPAVPGMAPPLKAICVAPQGMEEGSSSDVASEEFGLIVGEPVEFRFLSSTTRTEDHVGTIVEDLAGIEEVAPLELTLPGERGVAVPVKLRAEVTAVGTLELWCVSRTGDKWKLEYDLRASSTNT